MCSWKCAKDSIDEFDKSDPVLLTMCDIYEREMLQYKIIDRIADGEYPEYLSTLLNDNLETIQDSNQVELDSEITPGELSEIEDYDQVVVPEIIQEIPADVELLYFYDALDPSDFTKQLQGLVEYRSTEAGVGKNIRIEKIDVNLEENENVMNDYDIESVPTVVVLFKNELKSIFIGSDLVPIVQFIRTLEN
ncbi:MAG: hypothetical protein EHM34_10365 [Nitrosopumilales archaeon]|nr:MAG: hypothetical protein EHM34_10365 [Nitrosopumilales archaeon]